MTGCWGACANCSIVSARRGTDREITGIRPCNSRDIEQVLIRNTGHRLAPGALAVSALRFGIDRISRGIAVEQHGSVADIMVNVAVVESLRMVRGIIGSEFRNSQARLILTQQHICEAM